MKSNNQLGIPLTFYWSPILLLPLLSLGSAVILQLMGSRERLRAQTRPKPNYTTNLHSRPIQGNKSLTKKSNPPGFGRSSNDHSARDYLLIEQKGMPPLILLLN